MEQEIKRINDPQQLRQIIQKLFLRLPVTLKQKDGSFPATVVSYDNSVIEIYHTRPDAPSRLLALSHGEHNMFLECLVQGRNDKGNELVKPSRLHLQRQIRSEKRIKVDHSNVLLISNCLAIKSIPESFAVMNEKRDMLLSAYRGQISKMYPNSEIVFRVTYRMDPRMRLIASANKPIYIPDRTMAKVADPRRFIPLEEYKKTVRFDKMPDTCVGEVTEPLFYNKAYLFGYICVFSEKEITETDYDVIAQMGRDLESELLTSGTFPQNPEKCPVVDINTSGVGFMHPHNPAVMRNLMPGEHILFELGIGDTREYFNGVIKNMKSFEKAHRMGVQFENITALQKERLDEYIKGITKT